jgi:hypothetical protein
MTDWRKRLLLGSVSNSISTTRVMAIVESLESHSNQVRDTPSIFSTRSRTVALPSTMTAPAFRGIETRAGALGNYNPGQIGGAIFQENP